MYPTQLPHTQKTGLIAGTRPVVPGSCAKSRPDRKTQVSSSSNPTPTNSHTLLYFLSPTLTPQKKKKKKRKRKKKLTGNSELSRSGHQTTRTKVLKPQTQNSQVKEILSLVNSTLQSLCKLFSPLSLLSFFLYQFFSNSYSFRCNHHSQ